MATAKKAKEKSFEEALARLEEIAAILENEAPNLSEALALYEESASLLKSSAEMLEEAQIKITTLTKKQD